jgi:hypothetical protein
VGPFGSCPLSLILARLARVRDEGAKPALGLAIGGSAGARLDERDRSGWYSAGRARPLHRPTPANHSAPRRSIAEIFPPVRASAGKTSTAEETV